MAKKKKKWLTEWDDVLSPEGMEVSKRDQERLEEEEDAREILRSIGVPIGPDGDFLGIGD